MGCIASACASCCGSCIGSSICACCPSCCPTKTQSRVPYLVITALVTALALIMRYWGSGWVINLFVTSFEVCPTEKCVGQEAVYRLSAALCCFFAAHLFAIYFSNSATPHTSWWPAKILFLAVLCVVFFLIPNGPFDVYAIIARFVSGFFLLIQIMILIDFAHKWNKAWIADDKEWFWPLAGSTFALFGASVVVCVFLFIWFTNGGTSECRLETFFIVFTICLTVIVTILSLLVPWGSLLPSAVVSLYCFYLTYSALTSDPSSCNTLQTQTTAQVIIGILIACFTVCYAGWNISNEPNLFGVDTPEEQAAQVSNSPSNSYQQSKDVENPKDKDLSPSAAQDEKDEKAEEDAQLDEEQKSQLVKFHFVMAVVSMYVAMLLTSWGSQTGTSSASYDLSEVAMWIKIVSCWVTILLYSWTILAPKLFPDRDFGVEMPHD